MPETSRWTYDLTVATVLQPVTRGDVGVTPRGLRDVDGAVFMQSVVTGT